MCYEKFDSDVIDQFSLIEDRPLASRLIAPDNRIEIQYDAIARTLCN